MARNLTSVAASFLAFIVALAISGVLGCNIHELGHLISGKALGIPIDSISWCLPVNGRIAFSYQEPALVGFSGGLSAAAALGGFWWLVIRKKLGSAVWWWAGVAVAGTAISQTIVGIWEGSSPKSYGEAQDNFLGLIALAVLPLAVAAGIQLRSRPKLRLPKRTAQPG